jgi:subtilisin family serine protease
MKYIILLIFIFVFFVSFSYFDANAQNPEKPDIIPKNTPQKDVPVGNEAKIDSDIRKLIKGENSRLTRDVSDSANLVRFNQVSPLDEIEVYIYLDSKLDNLPDNIPLISRADNIVFTKLSANQIDSLASLDNVKRISSPINAVFYGHDVSEGVDFSFANLMHTAGYTGSGVTVAVIDESFLTSDTEISSNISGTWKSPLCADMTCGATAGNSHGTAVAEIVVDMAPNVSLRLYAIDNSVDFSNAIDDAIANNVDVITISLGFPTMGGDGTLDYFRDGTSPAAKKVNTAKDTGILVTVASGNEGNSHWQGTYSVSSVSPVSLGLSSDYESVMNFRPGASGVQRACLPVDDFGDQYIASWRAWDVTNQDYDFFLYDSSMNTIIDTSDLIQSGIESPIEIIPSGSPVGNACLVLASWDSTQNHFFHINAGDNEIDASVRVRSGSVSTPADATGALTVGAINQATNTLESFSSSGPTDDSRAKPEICGSDNTLSHQSGLNPFFGTSSATPHVAGAAALLLNQNSLLTVDQLQDKLIDESQFNVNYSIDNLCGSNSGALSLQNTSTACPPIPQSGTWTITYDCELTNNTTVPGNILIQNNSVLTIPTGIILDIDFTTKNLTITSGSGVLIKSGGKIT